MKDKDTVIQALRICSAESCRGCHYNHLQSAECITHLLKDALELIERKPQEAGDGDLISRKYLLKEYDRQHQGPPGGARKIIAEAPAEDVVPMIYDAGRCDYCHEDSDGYVKPIEKNGHAYLYRGKLKLKAKGWSSDVLINYCPKCGARMNGSAKQKEQNE